MNKERENEQKKTYEKNREREGERESNPLIARKKGLPKMRKKMYFNYFAPYVSI